MKRNAFLTSDYQVRAREFHVGDQAFPFLLDSDHVGRVVAVYPAIGMVDLQWPHGVFRFPVEDLNRFVVNDTGAVFVDPPQPENSDVPAGLNKVPVSRGPYDSEPLAEDTFKKPSELKRDMVKRVASKYMNKQALYWADLDRKYKATRKEIQTGNFCCPRCKDSAMRRVSYKREDQANVKLLACPSCLFLIKESDVLGHPSFNSLG
jgi:hypothetical protein